MLPRLFPAACVVSALVFGLPAASRAESITHSYTFNAGTIAGPLVGTEAGGSISVSYGPTFVLPRFDPALGTLESVGVLLDLNLLISTDNPTSETVVSIGTLGGPIFVDAVPFNGFGGGNGGPTEPAGFGQLPLYLPQTGPTEVTDPELLGSFIGIGDATLTVAGEGSLMTGGGATVTMTVPEGSSLVLVYNYSAVPESSSLSLVGLGLLALRRHRRAQ